MDCVIPGNGVRAFSCAVACLCRIGKELYVDFDPLDGLTLRTLNDAKSAFASFHFQPTFFERCSAPPNAINRSPKQSRRRRRNKKKQKRSNNQEEPNEEDDADEEESDTKYTCRVPLRTIQSVVKSRKGVRSLRIRSSGQRDHSQQGRKQRSSQSDNEEFDFSQEESPAMQLCLEFKIESSYNAIMRIVHRIGVAECDSVMAIAPKTNCSEIATLPRMLLKMLDPLRRTAEVALTVNGEARVVTMTSFHHADHVAGNNTKGGNALLAAASATVLKTETSMGCDEFDEYSYRNDRNESDVANDIDGAMPVAVNEEVSLVFGIKEVKALLQFCAQAQNDEEMQVIIYFEWGGRPIIFESEGESGGFSAQLIMATLDHQLLRGRGDVSNAT